MRKPRWIISLLLIAALGLSPMVNAMPLGNMTGNTPKIGATEDKYAYETAYELTACFGWEGDKHAPIAHIDGSYMLRDRGDLMITFGVTDIPGKIAWYNKEGYLPCFVSEYEKNGLRYVVESFADLVVIDGKRYEIAYSRMTTTNDTENTMSLPKVSNGLIPINESAASALTIQPGQTVVRDYAIGADRFGNNYTYPADSVIAAQGSWDEHYLHMKNYWNERLDAIAGITKLPNEELINAYKAGYIYTLIIADGYELNVGENGYDRVFDHDIIGIVSTLITIGDYTNVKEYMTHILDNVQYPDARWKYSWPYALYLQKTGDSAYIESVFNNIKTNTHYIETERTGNGGIMQSTYALDSYGSWLIDNWSALHGLTTYKYICDTLYTKTNNAQYKTESDWAKQQYTELLDATEKAQAALREKYNYPYLSIDMRYTTELSSRSDPRDANWASMFLFGRWAWDGYLFGADQTGSEMISLIDDTYTYGFERRATITDTIYNFGGYPHGYYSSSYNAGYGSSALRGEKYRDIGIKAYEFMINETMSGPFGWWEGIKFPNDSSPWNINHAPGGGGSCQHTWGQSSITKVLFDSLIAAKTDGSAIIGRGIPNEWITDGEQIEVNNYPVNNNARIGYNITTTGKTVTLTVTGNNSNTPISFELPIFRNNIVSAGGLSYNNTTGVVTVPAGTKTVKVVLKNDVEYITLAENLKNVIESAEEVDTSLYTTDSAKTLTKAIKDAKDLLNKGAANTSELNKAAEAINNASKGLVTLTVSKVGVDFTGETKDTAIFGRNINQIRRYQTFKTGDVTGRVSYIDVPLSRADNNSAYRDVVATLYTLEDDHKTLKEALGEARIRAVDFINGGINRFVFENVTLQLDTYYALVLAQEQIDDDIGGDPYYMWDIGENRGDDLFLIKDSGAGKFVDETSLGTAMLKIYFVDFNKKDLDTAVNEALSLKQADYTSDSWANFSDKLTYAINVLNDPEPTEDEYESAKLQLAAAIKDLKAASVVNIDALKSLVEKCESLKSEDYTEESWEKMQTALKNAKDVLSDSGADQSAIDNAYKQLMDAYDDLVNKAIVYRTQLKALIDEVKAINTDGRPGNLVKALQDALANAQDAYENPRSTAQQLKAAYDALITARNNLINDTESITDTTTTTDKTSDSTSKDPGPQTGDELILMPIVLMIITGVALIVILSRKNLRKNKTRV